MSKLHQPVMSLRSPTLGKTVVGAEIPSGNRKNRVSPWYSVGGEFS